MNKLQNAGQMVSKSSKQLLERRDDGAHLLDDLGQRPALETNTRVPLRAEGCIHAVLELRLARVRERQVLDEVLGRLLVALLGDDDV